MFRIMNIISLTAFLVFILINVIYSESYRILAIFPYNGKSHDIMFNALMMGLAEKNHQIDVITHFPPKNPPPNYKVIVNLNGSLENVQNNLSVDFVTTLSSNTTKLIVSKFGNRICQLLGLEAIQTLVKNPPNNPPYDLVITEAFAANCYMGFGYLLNVPVVLVSSTIEYPWINHYIGNMDNLAIVSYSFLTDFDKLKFWDRLKNVFFYHYDLYIFHTMTEKIQTELMRKFLNPNIPNIREVEKSAALILVNRHPVIYNAKPVTSSLIEVSGLHIKKNNTKLFPELQTWLDEGINGVIYFTFGSMVLIETLPINIITDFYKSFSKLTSIRILMKINDKSKLPEGLPKNVLSYPWIPQQAVLAHKNVRVFITHGGLMGCQEALFYGVPMIGIPLFADQLSNILKFVAKNMAIKINYNNLTMISIDEALYSVLNNPIYRDNAKLYSKIFNDRPMNSMDTAIFWIEYIIRNGPNILKSPALKLYWWQLALLDVYGFILFSLVFIVFFIFCIIKILLAQLYSLKKEKIQ
ncbi:PREDICTED: UDP-glucuronosyltransferase 2A1-like [Ceratosolen solmsi marchali]|uniref:UDP-glucuronosyltransferase n=1 Tax=Ceratosolen solmsi marchali TaxID=326594 RepID=A0AAJ7DX08_9HYME|nr:PREDICTED: UDP-glucuronosyltransferase 2A1-like [Ceratosolen solmsi marchali]